MNGGLERRVRRLERWNGVLLLALVVVGGSLGWRREPSDVVRADRIEIGDGTTRVGVAQFAHGGGGFALHGPEAKGAAVLYLKGDGSLTFFGPEGEIQARYPGG